MPSLQPDEVSPRHYFLLECEPVHITSLTEGTDVQTPLLGSMLDRQRHSLQSVAQINGAGSAAELSQRSNYG